MTTKPINEVALFDYKWLNKILIRMKGNLSFCLDILFCFL